MKSRPVPQARRVAIMADALAYGESRAAQLHNVSPTSIWNWFKPLGGYEAVKVHCSSVVQAAYADACSKLFKAVGERMGSFTADHLVQLMAEAMRNQKNDEKRQQALINLGIGVKQETNVVDLNQVAGAVTALLQAGAVRVDDGNGTHPQDNGVHAPHAIE